MHVSKWGNSLAIRLPAAVVEVLALKEGDEIEITVTDSRMFKVSRKASAIFLLAVVCRLTIYTVKVLCPHTVLVR